MATLKQRPAAAERTQEPLIFSEAGISAMVAPASAFRASGNAWAIELTIRVVEARCKLSNRQHVTRDMPRGKLQRSYGGGATDLVVQVAAVLLTDQGTACLTKS